MQLMIFMLTFAAAALAVPVNITEDGNVPTFGSYSFSYATQDSARAEVRQLDGTVRGAYNFLDEDGLFHEVKYVAGTNGFEIIKHTVKGPDGQMFELNNNDTPEVQSAKAAHLAYQAELRAVLPVLIAEDEPEENIPVFARHVPSPVKNLPHVPDVHIDAPTRLRHHEEISRRNLPVDVVEEIKQGPEVPALLASDHLKETVKPVVHHEVEPVVKTVLKTIVGHDEEFMEPLAADIMLINGFTPEVAEAMAQHLAAFTRIRANLPALEHSAHE